METRILTEVEEMINKVREEQGRPFDVRQLSTSCVANVIMNMMFGRRFDLCDSALQGFISDINTGFQNFSAVLEIFPVLRFLPYFKNHLATEALMDERTTKFINENIAACIEVCVNICCLLTACKLQEDELRRCFN